MISKIRFHLSLCVFQVAYGCCVEYTDAVRGELWDGNGGQNTDDRDNNQQLDQSEGLSIYELIKHIILRLFG
jgi:hypothetical protein